MEIRRIVKPEHVLLQGDGHFTKPWPCATIPTEDVFAVYNYSGSYSLDDKEFVKLVEEVESPNNFKLYERLRDGSITDPDDERSRVKLYSVENRLLGAAIKNGMMGWQIDRDPNRIGSWFLRDFDIYNSMNFGNRGRVGMVQVSGGLLLPRGSNISRN